MRLNVSVEFDVEGRDSRNIRILCGKHEEGHVCIVSWHEHTVSKIPYATALRVLLRKSVV
jgi:hypothetical protein